jgi:dTDP-glucose 4,6-dehydratase
VSTDEVYGEAPADYAFKENDPINPSNPYSAAKAAADLLVKSYSKTYGLDVVITRCSNNFGPNQFPEKLIPKTIISIITGSPIFIYGDGLQVRDWIFVENHVEALLSVMEKGQSGEIYNVSTQNLMTNLEMISRIQAVVKEKTGKDGQIVFVKDRPGHDRRYSIDSEKIKGQLNWKQITGFEDSLSKTIEWYVNNKKWWGPLLNKNVMHPQPWEVSWDAVEQK